MVCRPVLSEPGDYNSAATKSTRFSQLGLLITARLGILEPGRNQHCSVNLNCDVSSVNAFHDVRTRALLDGWKTRARTCRAQASQGTTSLSVRGTRRVRSAVRSNDTCEPSASPSTTMTHADPLAQGGERRVGTVRALSGPRPGGAGAHAFHVTFTTALLLCPCSLLRRIPMGSNSNSTHDQW